MASENRRYRIGNIAKSDLDAIVAKAGASLTIEPQPKDKVFYLDKPEYTVRANRTALEELLSREHVRLALCRGL